MINANQNANQILRINEKTKKDTKESTDLLQKTWSSLLSMNSFIYKSKNCYSALFSQ